MKKVAVGTIVALGLGAAAVFAQDRSPPAGAPGAGPGMMGPGYSTDSNAGYGPGRRGGFGMMGGRGMPGMMGGMGYGMGLGGMGALVALDLTEPQRKQVLSIQDEVRKKNWAAMGAMQDEMAKVRDGFWAGEKRDRAAILAGNRRMFEIRQQMLENSLDAAEKIEQVLTPQQRAQLRKHSGPGWMIDSDD
jgi:Spy/CpxP family protein refolding chaperone